jgi:inosose dehydratase
MLPHTKIGISPLTWTNDDLPELGGNTPFLQCIQEMSKAGFEGCDVGHKFPKKAQALKKALQPLGLSIANLWFSTYLCAPSKRKKNLIDFENQLEFLHAMGAKRIGVSEQTQSIQQENKPILENHKPIFSDWQWHDLFIGLEQMAETASQYNIELTYHHHMGTGIQTFEELSILMYNTSQSVGLIFDSGHFEYAGFNSLDVIRGFGARINHVHLKDIRRRHINTVKHHKLSFLEGVKLGTFTAPGDGDIDFLPILRALDAIKYEGWLIVEAAQDPAIAHPFTVAKNAHHYLKTTLTSER